ncbi:MAG: DNA-directed RNA polymerase subunit alpha C-terminal domain-containing protein, partial [Planctomycetota bacterium]
PPPSEIPNALQETLNISIRELDLSNRAFNCLEAEKIRTLYDLVQRTEEDLLQIRNFGRSSLEEIQSCLKNKGFSLGMMKGHSI